MQNDMLTAGMVTGLNGAPGRIRTCDLWLRRPTLYPTELRAQNPLRSVSWCARRDLNPQPTGSKPGALSN